MNLSRIPIYKEIEVERTAQIKKWGKQNVDLTVLATVLGEEFGEACHDILEARHTLDTVPTMRKTHIAHAREELIQVAAVAVKMIEQIDEGKS